MITLYRGYSNNGVSTILTEDAVEAYRERQANAERLGTYHGAASDELFARIARGTFAFVRASEMGYYGGFAAGSYDDLDRWLALGGATLSPNFSGSNFVPFSNGDLEGEQRFVRTPEEIAEAFGIDVDDVVA